jgi:hypothetical protein
MSQKRIHICDERHTLQHFIPSTGTRWGVSRTWGIWRQDLGSLADLESNLGDPLAKSNQTPRVGQERDPELFDIN